MTLEALEVLERPESDYKEIPFKKINIEVIDHQEQNYETAGDYQTDEDGTLHIRVSDTSPHTNFLVILHELIEFYLIRAKGIKEEDITNFDLRFEKMRKEYPEIIGLDEPGNSEKSPYNVEHLISSKIERWLGDNMEYSWEEHNSKLDKLEKLEKK